MLRGRRPVMKTEWDKVLDVLGAADEDAWAVMPNARWYELAGHMSQDRRLNKVQIVGSLRLRQYHSRRWAALD
jgi:hypothetical protein